MSLRIDIPLGRVFRVIDDKDVARKVACVCTIESGFCRGCVFCGSKDNCPLACCSGDRADGMDCIFVEVKEGVRYED